MIASPPEGARSPRSGRDGRPALGPQHDNNNNNNNNNTTTTTNNNNDNSVDDMLNMCIRSICIMLVALLGFGRDEQRAILCGALSIKMLVIL